MRVIPTRVHGMLDYAVGLVLIVAPWILGFADVGGAAVWLPVVLGAGVVLYSLMTNYELGVKRVIPVPTHLLLDAAGGALLAVSPWLFGFADDVYLPHLIVGLAEIGVSLMTEKQPRGASATAPPPGHG